MLRRAWMILFICTSCMCQAQQAELDSLLGMLRNHPKEDSVKLNILNNLAFAYARTVPARGIETAAQAIALAKKLGLPAKLAAAYNYMAVNYAGEGEDSVALTYYKQALALHQQTGNQLRVATTYNNIAISLVNLSNYPGALSYHTKALAIFERLGEKMRVANSLNNIGVIYLYVSDYDRALEYYLRALPIMEGFADKSAWANTLTNIGLVYDHLSDFSRALTYHNKALQLYQSNNDKLSTANVLGNIGNVYNDMDSSAQAIAFYTKALTISKAAGYKPGIASNYANLGIVYSGMGNYTQALYYVQQSLQLNKAAGDKQRMAGDFLQLGKIYLNAPANLLAQHGIQPGLRTATVTENEQRAIALSKEIGNIDQQRDAWQVLSTMYQSNGQGMQALSAYKNYVACRDSVINTETKLNITRREMEFDFEKREALATLENERQKAIAGAEIKRETLVRNAVVVGALLLAATALVSFSFYKKRRDAVEKQKEAEFNMQVADTEMKALRAQMNPHFIFNSINSIGDYFLKNNDGTATEYTAKFAKLMRMILENSEKKEVTIDDDLQALELYLQLEQLRMNNKFTYSIAVDESIDKHNTFIPPLLLQPFIENSIWHGIAKKQGSGSISISVARQGNMLKCVVKDDGIGKAALQANTAAGQANKSYGLNITKSRIDILNRQKKVNAGVKITFVDNGTTVELLLPLETDI